MNIKLERFPSISGLQQPFSKLIEKATTALRFSVSNQNSLRAPALDGEIVYSKNNVCVHQLGTSEPVPGYLSLRCSMADVVSCFTTSLKEKISFGLVLYTRLW